MSNPETVTLCNIERVVSAAIKPLERSIRYLNDSYGIVNVCIDNEFIIDDKIGNECIDNEFIIDDKIGNECIIDST
jgi:hypothetical protein